MRDGDRGHWLPYLEWMVTTSCDLACAGCDRFIDYDHRWHEDFEEMKSNMLEWSKRLDPDNFTIIGGEPLIHPKIYDIIRHSKNCFDHATIEVFSNGFLLPKKPDILDTLLEVGNSKLHITLHNQQENVRNKIYKNIKDFIIKELPWVRTSNNIWEYDSVKLEISDPTQGGWYDYRQKINGRLKPWNDNNPAQSYANCTANIYPIIYKNVLYKCPPISMLETHANKYGLVDDKDWEPYLRYKGLGLKSSERALEAFVDNINSPHPICGMCPADPKLKKQENAELKGSHHEV